MLDTLLSVIGGMSSLLREIVLWGDVLFILASVLSIYRGRKQRELSSVVDETPRSDITKVRSPGLVRVRGQIVPHAVQHTFTSPIKGDEDCVLSAWEIKEMYDTPKTDSWERAAWGVQASPFCVDDGTEKIRIEIDDQIVGNETSDFFTPETLLAPKGVSTEGLRCEFESFEVHVEIEYGESPPRRVAEFLETTDGISSDSMATDLGVGVDASKREYLEQTLQPGDEVSVLGHATPRREAIESTAHPCDLVLTQTEEATLHLSERSFDEIADGGGALLFGVLTGIAGIALLAAYFAF